MTTRESLANRKRKTFTETPEVPKVSSALEMTDFTPVSDLPAESIEAEVQQFTSSDEVAEVEAPETAMLGEVAEPELQESASLDEATELEEVEEPVMSAQPDTSNQLAPTPTRSSNGTGTIHPLSVTLESDTPCFTVINMDSEAIPPFTREFSKRSKVLDCISDADMLLSYMIDLERRYGVTLSFKAAGVDTTVFDQISIQQDGGPKIVSITLSTGEGDDAESYEAFYERITVDGIVYLSCISESLDSDYLHQVISEATEELHTHNQYRYTLVGPRVLDGYPVSDDSDEQAFLETLKLNSFELSIFISYIQSLGDVTIKYGSCNGKQSIFVYRE